MKLSYIIAAVIFLVGWGIMQIPSFTADLSFVQFDLPNPLYLVGAIVLFELPWITVTISLVILGIIGIFFLIGFIPNRSKKPS